MADNRRAYGLAKKYGIDTKGMSPKEVWEALEEKGITLDAADKTEQAVDKYSDSPERDKKAMRDSGQIHSKKKDVIELSKQEYAILRQEVMRKNSAQKGKVKPTNYAYTADYFYIYRTSGGDSFTPIKQLSIEAERDIIDEILAIFKGKI